MEVVVTTQLLSSYICLLSCPGVLSLSQYHRILELVEVLEINPFIL